MSGHDGVLAVEDDWLQALMAAETSLDYLRAIYPSKMMMLPETGHSAISRAMSSIQDGIGQMHRAGRYVMGADAYEDFLRDRVYENSSSTRGDQDV